jgi:hypothetical protein
MRAFHNDPEIQAHYLAQVHNHYDADEIIRGVYWDAKSQKGCAVGCVVHQDIDAHRRYEKALGIPQTIAMLQDWMFENMTSRYAKKFPLEFLSAIPLGADLSRVPFQVVDWLESEHDRIEVRAALFNNLIRLGDPGEGNDPADAWPLRDAAHYVSNQMFGAYEKDRDLWIAQSLRPKLLDLLANAPTQRPVLGLDLTSSGYD